MSSLNEGKDVLKGNDSVRCLSTDLFGLIYRIIDCLLLFGVLLYQNCSLSYYITAFNAHNNGWYFLFLVDFVLIFLFITGALFACRHYRRLHVQRRRRVYNSDENKFESNDRQELHQIFSLRLPKGFGTLPLLWINWILYTIVLSIKIFVLHLQNIANQLYKSSAKDPLPEVVVEPHTIRLTLAAMTVVFLLWIEIHRNHNNKQSFECIKELTTTVVFEIFDSIDLLDLLLPDSNEVLPYDPIYSDRLSVVILVLATINLLLPTIGLFRLSEQDFSSHRLGLRMNILHNCLRIVLVNIPYIILRVSFWIAVKRELSIFVLKNALFVFVSIRHIVSEVHELKQLKETPEDNELALNVVSDENPIKGRNGGDDINT